MRTKNAGGRDDDSAEEMPKLAVWLALHTALHFSVDNTHPRVDV